MKALLATLLLAFASAASADLSSTATSLAAAPLSLEKCGEAKLKVLFWDVYESSLFTPTGRYEEGERPLRLEIRYLRDIRAADLVRQTGAEWEAQGLQHPNQADWLEQLQVLWPDVSKNDVLALEIDATELSRFTFNGKPLGSIDDPAFGAQFAAIWLSPNTTRPALRSALIGES